MVHGSCVSGLKFQISKTNALLNLEQWTAYTTNNDKVRKYCWLMLSGGLVKLLEVQDPGDNDSARRSTTDSKKSRKFKDSGF